ncbi:concanavalin A-like lectin/glucanase domain-containing protein [Kalaharituber pfeilii]|nr:concanavalin A-like lectin/glucanase domain-containing protein [Kalaharituber pfeilii]
MLLNLCTIGFSVILGFIPYATAQCECGYLVGKDRFTHSILSHFGRLLDQPDIADGSGNELNDWEVQGWSTNGTGKRGSERFLLPKKNEESNVFIQGGALNLQQTAYTEDDEAEGRPVLVSEIVTRRSDILYGSFRSRFKIIVEEDTEGGAVAGFFFYHGDQSETDIEILTREDELKVHYSQQPTYDYETDVFYEDASLTANLQRPWTEAQEYRWDWHPGVSHFYQDGIKAAEMIVNTPSRKGKIMINLWADGGQWSGRPANKNVTMQIQTIELFFNTSLSHSGGDSDFNKACEEAGGISNENTSCVVEELPEDHGQESSATRVLVSIWWGACSILWAIFVMRGYPL